MAYHPAEETMRAAVRRNRATIVKKSNGQPPKSKERRQFQAWTVSLLLQSYKDPRAVLMEIASMDTLALAKMLALHGEPSGDKDDNGNDIVYRVKPHHIADPSPNVGSPLWQSCPTRRARCLSPST
jgi:hypothetical protein